jgi:hypothetical protein
MQHVSGQARHSGLGALGTIPLLGWIKADRPATPFRPGSLLTGTSLQGCCLTARGVSEGAVRAALGLHLVSRNSRFATNDPALECGREAAKRI